MSPANAIALDDLLLELFHALRAAGMALTMEQYALLRQAIARGQGLGGWADLRRICRLLWVKPSPNYAADVFDRTFTDFVEDHQIEVNLPAPRSPAKQSATDQLGIDWNNLPVLPPGRARDAQKPEERNAPVAIQTDWPAAKTDRQFRVTPRYVPLSLETIQQSWRSLRRPVRNGLEMELDLEKSIANIEQEGVFGELVFRPVQARRAELLLLIDDETTMIPFRWVVQPWIQAITSARITPARIYRFTAYPDEYLYPWRSPNQAPIQAEALTLLLPRLHRNRTVVMVISDGGAAIGTYSPKRVEGIARFLARLRPCVRQVLWLNPVPMQRWQRTSAGAIATLLAGYANGQMVPFEAARLQLAAQGRLAG